MHPAVARGRPHVWPPREVREVTGEWYAGRSDIDFVAVLAERPDEQVVDQALRAFTQANLREYWAPEAEQLRRFPAEAARPDRLAWFVLGTSRLHHLLATDRLTSSRSPTW